MTWDGSSTAQLDLHLIALVPDVAAVAQSHLAYPVIHYFHSESAETALGPSMAALDAALTANGVLAPEVRMDRTSVEPLRVAVGRFLQTLRVAFLSSAALELIANGRTEDQVQTLLGADWLVYQGLDDLVDAVRDGRDDLPRFDTSCFSGEYVTGLESSYLRDLELIRSDEAKQARRLAS